MGIADQNSKLPYRVRVYDNFHYMDLSESMVVGEFATYEEALEAAKRIVERSCLEAAYDWASYTGFGEDPAIEGPDLPEPFFSAWNYAREVCSRQQPEAPV